MPWLDDDEWYSDSSRKREVLQQKIKYTYINNEDDARVRHSSNYRESYAIVNRDEKNAWGSERGYAVHPGLSPIHNVSCPPCVPLVALLCDIDTRNNSDCHP